MFQSEVPVPANAMDFDVSLPDMSKVSPQLVCRWQHPRY